jgi:cytochrome oxidase Cu insertion factor (SCO1/SenC/PrrC family)
VIRNGNLGAKRAWTLTVGGAAAVVALALLSCASSIEVVVPAADETESASSGLTPRGGLAWRNYFPNVELTTHNGDQVRFYDDLIKGKVVVINFMYATCTDS